MPEHAEKIREIRAQIDAHAPYPAKGEVSPVAMARHLAMTALTRRVRLDCTPVSDTGMPARYRETDALCADFAAAVAFWALADKGMGELDLGVSPPLVPDAIRGKTPVQVAALVRGIWESGELGEWLWEFLGKDVAGDVTALVTQMTRLAAEAKAPEPGPYQGWNLIKETAIGCPDCGEESDETADLTALMAWAESHKCRDAIAEMAAEAVSAK